MLSRRRFIGIISIVSSVILIFLNACKRLISLPSNYAITNKQAETLTHVHNHLFPKDNNSPGASDINSVQYVRKILTDPQVNDKDKRRLLFGINWTEESAQELYKKPFNQLQNKEKEKVLLDLQGYNNGEKWLSHNITYILEALLADPVYQVNTNQAGWNWLKHTPGYPRPDLTTKYPNL